jgi:hypothetical protein
MVEVQQRGFGSAWGEGFGTRPAGGFGRRTVVALQFDARRQGEAQIAAPGGAGEQIIPQGDRAEHPALHAMQDGGDIVGAEEGRRGGEFRRGCAGGGGRGEVAGVGDKDGEDVENSPDTPWDGAGFCGDRGGWVCSGHWVGDSRSFGTNQELYDWVLTLRSSPGRQDEGADGPGVGGRSQNALRFSAPRPRFTAAPADGQGGKARRIPPSPGLDPTDRERAGGLGAHMRLRWLSRRGECRASAAFPFGFRIGRHGRA